MTLIAASIAVDRPDGTSAALERAAQARADGADLVEWRLDTLAAEPGAVDAARRLVRESPMPCIVTVRIAAEGGGWDGDEADRVSFLEAVCTSDCPPRYIDMELSSLERSANLRQKVLLCVAHPAQVREGMPGLIVSTHDFTGRPADLSRRVGQMWGDAACAVAKVAWRARSVRDVSEAAELLKMRTKPTAAICMGEFGLMTRVLAPKLGAFLTYAHADGDSSTAPGQPGVRELVSAWGMRAVGQATATYGVIGWPVAQSRSPHLHNGWFAAHGIDARYFPLPVAPGWESFKATAGELRACEQLSFRGASVTHPHKEHLLRYVLECGGEADAASVAIGAANTLVCAPEGRLRALNTDAPAVAEVMRSLARPGAGWAGARVGVIGAGGAARAAAYAMAGEGSDVTILARRIEQASEAAAALSARAAAGSAGRIAAAPIADVASGAFDALIHATPLGMAGGPDESASPLADAAAIAPRAAVLDMVSVPEETPLIAQARARGARVATGMALLVAQARRQFVAWTGVDPGGPASVRAWHPASALRAHPILCLCALAMAWLCMSSPAPASASSPVTGHGAARTHVRAPEFGTHADPMLFEDVRAWCGDEIAIAPAEWIDVCAAHRDYLAAWAAAENRGPLGAGGGDLAGLDARGQIDAAFLERLRALLGEGAAPALDAWRQARRCTVAEQMARESGGAVDALRASVRTGVPFELRSAVSAYARISEDSARALAQLRMRADAGEDVDQLRAAQRDIRARWLDAEASFVADCAAAGPAGEWMMRETLAGAYPDLTRGWMVRAQLMRAMVAGMPALEPRARTAAVSAVDLHARTRWSAAESEIRRRRESRVRLPDTASRALQLPGDPSIARSASRSPGIESVYAEEDAALLASLAEAVGAERAQAIRAIAYAELEDSVPAIARIVGEDGAEELLASLPRGAMSSVAQRGGNERPARTAAYALPDAMTSLRPALEGLGARIMEAHASDDEDRRALGAAARDDSVRWARDVAPAIDQLTAARHRAEEAVRAGDLAAFDAAAASFLSAEASCRDAVARHDGETWSALERLAMRSDGVPAWVRQLRLARSLEVQAPHAPLVGALHGEDGEAVTLDLLSLAAAVADPDAWDALDPGARTVLEAGLVRVLSDGASGRRAALEAAIVAERARIRADLALREVDSLVRQHGSPPAGDPAAFAIQQARMRSASASAARAQAVTGSMQADARAALRVMRALEDSASRAGDTLAAWQARRFLVSSALADGVPEWSASRALLLRSERGDWCDALDAESARAAAELWASSAAVLERCGQHGAGTAGPATWTSWRTARGQLEQSAQRIMFLAGLPGLKAPAMAVPVTATER